MKRRAILLLLIFALLLVVGIIWRWPIPPPVTVSFVGYTKEYGGYSLGHFQLTNHTKNKSFVCYQGPIHAQIRGQWIEDAERVGRQHDPIIEPGETIKVSILAPTDATLWRSSFTLNRIYHGPASGWQSKRMEIFRKLGIKRFADEGMLPRQRRLNDEINAAQPSAALPPISFANAACLHH